MPSFLSGQRILVHFLAKMMGEHNGESIPRMARVRIRSPSREKFALAVWAEAGGAGSIQGLGGVPGEDVADGFGDRAEGETVRDGLRGTDGVEACRIRRHR